MVNKESKSGARVVPVQLRSRSSQQCPCPWRNRHRPRAKVIGACTVHLEHKRTRQRLLVGRPRSLPIATAKINRNALSDPRGGRASRSTQQSRNLTHTHIYIIIVEATKLAFTKIKLWFKHVGATITLALTRQKHRRATEAELQSF